MLRPRLSIPRDKFSAHFNGLKSQVYNDHIVTNARGGVPQPQSSIRSISWNPMGNLVATGSSDKSVRVWNPEKPHVRFSTELKGHLAPVEKVAFNPVKDSELASLSVDGVVRIWDARSKACSNEIKGLGDAVTLVWAPDGESLLVGNKSAVLYICSPTQPTPLSTHQQGASFNHVAFCFSGQRVFVALESGKVRVLGYPSLEPLMHLPLGSSSGGNDNNMVGASVEFTLDGHTWSCLSAEMQPTARYLATGGADSLIAFWDTAEWLCLRTSTSIVGAVCSLSFTFDGTYIVGGSDECSNIDVVHVETGELVHTFRTTGPNPVVAWAPTRYCLAYSDSGVLRIIGVDDRK